MMITLYLKDCDITSLPPGIAMFYRLGRSINKSVGKPELRLCFASDEVLNTFKTEFPEMIEYLEMPEAE